MLVASAIYSSCRIRVRERLTVLNNLGKIKRGKCVAVSSVVGGLMPAF